MAIRYLKRGRSDADTAQDGSKVRATVERTLKKDQDTWGRSGAGAVDKV